MENLANAGVKYSWWRRVQFNLSQFILYSVPFAVFSFFKVTLVVIVVFIVKNCQLSEFENWSVFVWIMLMIIAAGYLFFKGIDYCWQKGKANAIAFKEGTYYKKG